MKRTIVAGAVCLMFASLVSGQPARNISAAKHPNLAAAQKLVVDAFNKITAAQKANEFDLSGHAQKAKDLLDQASRELKLAAEAANVRKK